MASILLRAGGRAGGRDVSSTSRSALSTAVKRNFFDIRSALPSFLTPHQQQLLNSTTTTTKHHNFSTSSNKMSGSAQYIETLKARRTIYQLSNSSPISDAKIQEIVKDIVLHTPSSFNSQSTRAILLVKEEHEKLWEITKEVLKAIVPAEGWAATEGKLNGFKAAYGTVLFFVSRSAVVAMQKAFALYADKFPIFATQSDGAHHIALWTALEAEGFGANLQHYNPLIDAKVAEAWKVDPDWELSAQLVFGKPEGAAGEKTFAPIEDRVKVFGA